jgi:hypothetical protein
MAHENLLTTVKSWVENSARELELLLKSFGDSPAPLPNPGTISGTLLDIYSLAAACEANIASDVQLDVINLKGIPAKQPPFTGASDEQLLRSMTLSQISLAASVKALLLMYRVLSLPFPPPQSAPFADELALVQSIVCWLEKQSADLKTLLSHHGLKPVPPPIPLQFKDVNDALTSWELSLTNMAQDLAYAMSQHPRHLTHPRKGFGPHS